MMMTNLLINPQIRALKSLIDEIKKGSVCVPPFQRDFVWTREQIKDLFSSIQHNYPIGSILLWKPDKQYSWTPNYMIGGYQLEKRDEEGVFILDGYQRLSSIFSCLTNPNTADLNKSKIADKGMFDLFYDLSDESFIYLRNANARMPYQVPLYVFMSTSEFRKYSRAYIEPFVDGSKLDLYLDRADDLSRKLVDYQFACVEIKGANIQEAVEIFSRLNSKGVEISMDWMINALTYNDDFRFANIIDELISKVEDMELGTPTRNSLFRCFQSAFGKMYFDQSDVDRLAKRTDFKEMILKANENILRAFSFLKNTIKLPSLLLLPYDNQLIFLMEFFSRYPNAQESELAALEKWFWLTSYSNYFTVCSLSDQRKAFSHFVQCLHVGTLDNLFYPNGKNVNFESLPLPNKLMLGAVRSKVVCLYVEKFMPELLSGNKKTSSFYDQVVRINRDKIIEYEQIFVTSLGIKYGQVANYMPSNS